MLDLEYSRGVVVVRFHPVPQRSLDHCLLDRLTAALAYISPDNPIVLTGTGPVFAPDLDVEDSLTLGRLAVVRDAVLAHPRPVVAAINGDAVGAAWTLAEAADVRVMSGGVIQPAATPAVRYPVQAAVAAGLVEHSSTPAALLADALTLAGRLRSRVAVAG